MFLLIEQDDLRNRFLRLAGLDRLNVMTQALEDATRRVSRYLMLQLLVNFGFGMACAAGLYLIGVPYAILWGAVAGILRIVPYVGSLVAALLPIILALAVFDNWKAPLLVVLLFGVLELVTGNFLEPWLYGAHTGISSLALLLTTVFWTVLWGPAGLILSTPLTVCVVVLGRHVPQFAFLYILLGDEPVLEADARVYQRLLALDDQQARDVAALYLADNSLAQLYDSVLIPALALAEQDRHKGALDKNREEFLFLSLREIITEFSEERIGEIQFQRTRSVPLNRPGNHNVLPQAIRGRRNQRFDVSPIAGTSRLCVSSTFPLDVDLRHSDGNGNAGVKRMCCSHHFRPPSFRIRSRARTHGAAAPRSALSSHEAGYWSVGIRRR